ncbi:hypothetical protein GIB67_002887 [Kingdonia uniflora]|uniref:Uncharacterized protein n=1 Tax=Kingdonia uniflora TaxID=39325 RepID=A0A7J7NQS2_9MAGN|nr:hypothetical protein GIB67_002887 [Kingdonia uniflora]
MVSDDEAAFLSHGDANDENNVLSLWYDGLKLLIVTDGKEGRANGFAVKTVDTTGARDGFVGNFFLPYQRMKLTPHTDMEASDVANPSTVLTGKYFLHLETSFNSLMPKISQLRESVKSKRLQLINFNKTTTTSTIIQSQMPHLDEWSALEVDYSTSLSGAIIALQAASLRLPVNENVRVDIEELEGALNSASNVIETTFKAFCQRYVSTHDVTYWSRSFMQDLERSCKDHFRRRCYAMGIGFGFRLVALDANFKNLEISTIESAYKKSRKRAIMLDYDGTVMPQTTINKTPSDEDYKQTL